MRSLPASASPSHEVGLVRAQLDWRSFGISSTQRSCAPDHAVEERVVQSAEALLYDA